MNEPVQSKDLSIDQILSDSRSPKFPCFNNLAALIDKTPEGTETREVLIDALVAAYKELARSRQLNAAMGNVNGDLALELKASNFDRAALLRETRPHDNGS